MVVFLLTHSLVQANRNNPKKFGTLYRDRRGASLVEYIILVGLVAIACFAGFSRFGSTTKSKVEAQADCITDMAGCNGQAPIALGNGGGDTPQSNPPFDKVKDAGKATYKDAKGKPFARPAGDDADVHPRDISQGQLGDCWFMSSLAAIANRNPDILKRNIKDLGNGSYEVTLYEKTWYGGTKEVKVTVKGDFPQNPDGSWRFAQPGAGGKTDADGNQKLWPMIYEKAMAQYRGGYDKMSGWPADAMFTLTGQSSSNTTPKGILWDMSFNDFANLVDNNAVAPSTLTDDDAKNKDIFKSGKLVGNHAYWVQSVDRKNQTVTVRNPWGWNNAPVTLTWDEFKNNFRRIDYNPVK